MTAVGTIVLAVLFLGFPFYWGAFGHPGYILPVVWAVIVALGVELRHWGRFDRTHLFSAVVTLAVSLAACVTAFALGRFLGEG